MIQPFCQNLVNYFRKKATSQMFDWVRLHLWTVYIQQKLTFSWFFTSFFKLILYGEKLWPWKKFFLFLGNSFNFKIKKERSYSVASNNGWKCVKSCGSICMWLMLSTIIGGFIWLLQYCELLWLICLTWVIKPGFIWYFPLTEPYFIRSTDNFNYFIPWSNINKKTLLFWGFLCIFVGK